MIKTRSLLKLTVVTLNLHASVNLISLQNCVQMNTKNMSRIVIVKRMKLRTAGIKKKLLMEKQVNS